MLTIKKENRIFINTDLEAPEKIIKEHEKFIQYIPKEFNEVFKKLTQPNEEIRMKEFEEMATKSLEKIKKLFEEKRNSKETKVEKKKEYKWEVVIQPQVRLSNTGQINQTACSKHEEQKIENSREKMQSYIEVDGVRTTERGIIKTKSKTTTPDPYRFIPQ